MNTPTLTCRSHEPSGEVGHSQAEKGSATAHCRHCKAPRVRARGLCRACYYCREIRDRYPDTRSPTGGGSKFWVEYKASLAHFRAVARMRLRPFQERYNRGQNVRLEDVFAAVRMRPLQRLAIIERIAGRSADEIAKDRAAAGRSGCKTNVQRAERRALARLGLNTSVTGFLHGPDRAARRWELREACFLIRPGEMGIVLPDEECPVRRTLASRAPLSLREELQEQLEALAGRWIRQAGTAAADRIRAEAEALAEKLAQTR
jgi:hypothetical protein